MSNFLSKAGDFLDGFTHRITHAISLDLSQNQLIRMLVIVILYISVIRPWMLKLADKEGQKQLAEMEKRDKEKLEKRQQEEAVNNLRSGKKPVDDSSSSSTAMSDAAAAAARERSSAANSATGEKLEMQTAEEIRAHRLENWDEDQEFLRNFAKGSDRAH